MKKDLPRQYRGRSQSSEPKLSADGPDRLALRDGRADGRTGLLKGAVYSPSPGAVADSSYQSTMSSCKEIRKVIAFPHAEMCENWHYSKLGDYIKKQSIEEMKHAESLIERILFLDGTPTMNAAMTLSIGKNVREQLEGDLKLELGAVTMYNRCVKVSREEGDNASRELFERLLKDEEEHVDWLEAQFHQITEMGYKRYLAQQIRDEK
ncbi:MAG TPA: bacterioferritin [Candidatus Acidoferrum sp.]|nr:bacterioferritin [Candidatus Acidoferrum sp.]